MEEEIGMMRRSARAALAEIPNVIGQLHVSPPPMPIQGAVVPDPLSPALPRHALTPNTRDNTPMNHDNSVFLSPTPSPDELVIQQRGRKKLPVMWSPDIDHKKQSPFQTNNHTPPKSTTSLFNSIRSNLRSTPKKRILLNEFEKIVSPKKSDSSEYVTPIKAKNSSPNKSSPAPKRLKVDNKLQLDNKTSLELALKAMSHGQLIEIIKNITHQHPNIEEELKDNLTVPDLKPLEENLINLKRNIFRSLPTSRLTSKTDSPAYSRAATHLTMFKKQLFDQGRILVESQQWKSVIEYATFSWKYVRATPLWDNHAHNAIRRHCFKFLAGLFMNSLKKGQFDKMSLNDIHETIEGMVIDSDDIQSCIKWIDVQIQSM